MAGGAGDWRKMHNEELSHTILFSSSSQGILGWAGHITTRSQCLSVLQSRQTGYPASILGTTDIFLLPTASRPVRIIHTPIQWRHHRLLFLMQEGDHQRRTEGGLGVQPPRNSERPPKSCQTLPDCENC